MLFFCPKNLFYAGFLVFVIFLHRWLHFVTGTFIEKLLVSILNMSLRYLRISCKISFVVIIMSEEMTYADMAELADALVLGTSGQPCRFKSCYPHQ